MKQPSELPSDTVVEIAKKLISFDTTSYRTNLELIDYAAQIFSACGANIHYVYDKRDKKANLFATIGPTDRPGIVLSGHTDVVPVDGQDWTSDPFSPVCRDGRLYGRGSCDMKGFLALCLATAPDFAARPLTAPVHFALSYDEEIGCVGVRGLLQQLRTYPVKPKMCIVGEPTEMKIIVGHKGKKNVLCQVHGKEVHSALNHRGVNAVEIAAELITFLRHMQRKIKAEGPFDPGYDPPYTTVHTGTVRGGTALNIVPALCEFEFEFRNLPDHDVEHLMAQMRGYAQDLIPEMLAVDDAAGIYFNEQNTTIGLSSDGNQDAVDLTSHLCGHSHTSKVSFTTEAGLFSQIGIPTVVCGPGSILQAHKPDEYIELSQLQQGQVFLHRLLDYMTAP